MDQQRITVTEVTDNVLTLLVRVFEPGWDFSVADDEFAVRALFAAYEALELPPFLSLDGDALFDEVPPHARAAVAHVERTRIEGWTPGVPLADIVEAALQNDDEAALPVATYQITVHDAALLAPLAVRVREANASGAPFEFWSDATSAAVEEMFDPQGYSPLRKGPHAFEVGARVYVWNLRHNAAYAGAARGTVVEARNVSTPVPYWQGSSRVFALELDVGGPRAWAFSEDMVPAPDDAYEAARREPHEFLRMLLARPAKDRAAALEPWMLGTGAYGAVVLEDGTSVWLADRGGVLYGVLRQMPFAEAFTAAVELVHGFATDAENHGLRHARDVVGRAITQGQTAFEGMWVYRAPLELTLSDLALLVAHENERAPFTASSMLESRAAPGDVEILRTALAALTPVWMGNDAKDQWQAAPYLLHAMNGTPGRLPASFREGFPDKRAAAERAGLGAGVLVHPIGVLKTSS